MMRYQQIGIFGGDLRDCNQHYGEDELDRLYATVDEMDLSPDDGPAHRGVT
jgi:hypothetical protein